MFRSAQYVWKALIVCFLPALLPAQFQFTIFPQSTYSLITCKGPAVFTASTSAPVSGVTYTWTGPVVLTGSQVAFTSGGTYTVSASINGSFKVSKVISVGTDVMPPLTLVMPVSQTLDCTQFPATTITVAVNTNSAAISHSFFPPAGNHPYTSVSYTTLYVPKIPGVYASVVQNMLNGCISAKTVEVTSANSPSFQLASPKNFLLGCGTQSAIGLSFTNVASQLGTAITYTILKAGQTGGYATTNSPSFQVTAGGVYTAIAKEITTGCESSLSFIVTQNTVSPPVSVSHSFLSCMVKTDTLRATSGNVSFKWDNGVTVHTLNPIAVPLDQSLPATATLQTSYTLSVTDLTNSCISTTHIPVYRNVFPPVPYFDLQHHEFNCKYKTLTISNKSQHGYIGGNWPNQPLVIHSWLGLPLQQINSDTLRISLAGSYYITVKDLSNGCQVLDTLTFGIDTLPPALTPTFYPCLGKPIEVGPVLSGTYSSISYLWDENPWQVYADTAKTAPTKMVYYVRGHGGTYLYVTVTNNENGCSIKKQIRVSSCAAINENLWANIKVFPNPTSDFVSIENPIQSTLRVFSIHGKLLASTNEANAIVDLTKYSPGIYFIEFSDKQNRSGTVKLVKKD